jgi:hypothetical protein
MDLGLLGEKKDDKTLVEFKMQPMGLTPLMIACCLGK